jgi:lambda family phage tail tape measure protein
MATSITDFLIRVKVQGQQLVDNLTKSTNAAEKGMNNASTAAGKFGNAVKGMGNSLQGAVSTGNQFADTMFTSLGRLGPLGAVAGVAATAFAALGVKAMGAADAIQDISDATGISAGRLVNFKESILNAGGRAEDFEKIAVKLTQTLGDASEGNEKVRKSFKDLGVDLGDANGKLRATDELLPEIINALAQIENPAERSAKAVELLGKSAARIDWTQVKALNDPFKDAEIAQLAKYQGAIDAIGNSIEKSLITTFGRLALKIQEAQAQAEKTEKELNAKGQTLKGVPTTPGPGRPLSMTGKPRDMTEEEKRAQFEAEQAKLMAPYKSRAGVGRDDATKQKLTGELAITDEGKKQIELARLQTNQLMQTNDQAVKYQEKLNGIIGLHEYEQSVMRSNLAIENERDNKLADINRQIQTELANKERDSRITGSIVSQLREQGMQVAIQADRMKSAKEEEIRKTYTVKVLEEDRLRTLQNITNQYNAQVQRQQQLANLLQTAREKEQDVQFGIKLETGNPLEGLADIPASVQNGSRAIQVEYAKIQEEARKAALEAGRTFASGFEGMDLTSAQSQELANGLGQIAQKYKDIATAQTSNLTASRTWEQGWKQAFDSYMDSATNAAVQAGQAFQSVTSNMNSAIDNFVTTGKFSFADLSRSIIQDLIKIELKAQASKLLGAIGGGGGIFSAIGSLFGFANGGTPPLNKPSIVGERGPELFMPKSAGTIIPNEKLGGGGNQISAPITNNYITNNISAVDAKSVAQLFAENRKTLLGTVEMARKELPYNNR